MGGFKAGPERPPQCFHGSKKEGYPDRTLEERGGEASVQPCKTLGAYAGDSAMEGAAVRRGAELCPAGLGLDASLDGVKGVACKWEREI